MNIKHLKNTAGSDCPAASCCASLPEHYMRYAHAWALHQDADMKPTHYCIKCGEMATLVESYHAKDDLYWCLKCLTDADGEHTGNAETMMPLTPDDESDGENAQGQTRPDDA